MFLLLFLSIFLLVTPEIIYTQDNNTNSYIECIVYSPSYFEEDFLQYYNISSVNMQDELGFSFLFIAVIQQDLNLVQYALQQNANVNIKDQDGNTPLHWAVMTGNATIVEYLLFHHANPYLKNKNGLSVLNLIKKKEFLFLRPLFNKFE